MARQEVDLNAIAESVEKMARRSARRVYEAQTARDAVQARIDRLTARLPELTTELETVSAVNEKNQDALAKLGRKRVEYTPPAKPENDSETPADETETVAETPAETVAEQLSEASETPVEDDAEPDSASASDLALPVNLTARVRLGT